MDSNLKREIMIDNYQNPVNKKSVDDECFIKIHHKRRVLSLSSCRFADKGRAKIPLINLFEKRFGIGPIETVLKG